FLFFPISASAFWLLIQIDGSDPPITPYVAKTHGYSFETDLPVLIVKLKHDDTTEYAYSLFQDIIVMNIKLSVHVFNVKTLAVSNDFGPVDASKPFQPYGASPVAGNALIIGSKEIFQKRLSTASIIVSWLVEPVPYKKSASVNIDFLSAGQWSSSNIAAVDVKSRLYDLTNNLDLPVVDEPDLTPNEFYNTASRNGFVRLKLSGDFGQSTFQADLLKYINKDPSVPNPPVPPPGPSIGALSMDYAALQTIALDST